jgi:ABC-2 type transport system ATP-binding protein
MTAMIQATSLSKWFGEVVAVNNLDLNIEEKITGLLGPNGAGKSTFIKLALGLYKPSRGSVLVFGDKPRNNMSVLRRIGYCPETDNFFENASGFEFVYHLNKYWGMGRKQARIAAENACELTRMTARMHDPIDTYSKGMRQRIKIAQALSTNPELLFLDEPMNGLDPRGRDEMYALIQALADAGMTVVVSSHILYEIERITDSVALIFKGSLLAQGHVREIRNLIDKHPHAIRVQCALPRQTAAPFIANCDITSVDFEENAFVMRTRDPNQCYEMLNEMMLRSENNIRAIECADDSLQSVFDYLTR